VRFQLEMIAPKSADRTHFASFCFPYGELFHVERLVRRLKKLGQRVIIADAICRDQCERRAGWGLCHRFLQALQDGDRAGADKLGFHKIPEAETASLVYM